MYNMKKIWMIFALCAGTVTLFAQQNDYLRISKQLKAPSTQEAGAWDLISRIEAWKPTETAIIICDMWDKHWCDDATARVAEMAPEMNKVIAAAREKGVIIRNGAGNEQSHCRRAR